MSRIHNLVPTGPMKDPITVRLGSGTGAGVLSSKDEGKFVKLVADSRYDLAVAGDPIEGAIVSVEAATSAGYTIGSVVKDKEQMFFALADGLQATAGTGTIAVGDYVLVGTPIAKGTAQTSYPKVCKATTQPAAGTPGWRVVGLFNGSGAVGAIVTIAYA